MRGLSRGFSNFFEKFFQGVVAFLLLLIGFCWRSVHRPLTIIIILFFAEKSIGISKVIYLTILRPGE
jgi:hypothetical protein